MSLHHGRFGFFVVVASLLLDVGSLSAQVAEPSKVNAIHTVSAGGIAFSVNSGLTIEKVAAEPLIKWPIVVDWDPQGRLVVAESGGVGWPIQKDNELKRHNIVRLVDTDGDGHFDRRILAASELAFPEGVLCLDQDIFVAAPPVIWRLTDADDDGFCEQREIWFDGETVTNCANDLHGPYLGRDGWIYWCKGAFGEQIHSLMDGRRVSSKAAHVYRRRRSGGPIEPVISGGMDNPVEVAITPEGETFFTSTFLVHPGNGQRDGIAHAIYGAVFGKDHHVVEGLTRTGPLFEPMTHLGPAAPSGLINVESELCKTSLGLAVDARTLLAASFNLHKITSHQLVPDGATYRTIDRDVLTTEQIDFHPTDIVEDADGSLLVIDTGGWYDLCCPTSRVDQKAASGGIYRISVAGKAAISTAETPVEWKSLDIEGLFAAHHDPRPWISRTAGLRMESLGDSAVSYLADVIDRSDESMTRRQSAIWLLCRIESPGADMAIAERMRSLPVQMQVTALHALSIRRSAAARQAVESLLQHESAVVRRAAAECLGRIGDKRSAQTLLQAYLADHSDRHLAHAIVFALVEILRQDASTDLIAWADQEPMRNAAYIALQQIGHDRVIDDSQLMTDIQSNHSELRNTARSILMKRPGSAIKLIGEIRRMWQRSNSGQDHLVDEVLQLVAGWREAPEIKTMIHDLVRSAASAPETQQYAIARHLADLTDHPIDQEFAKLIATWLDTAAPPVHNEIVTQLDRRSDYATAPSVLTETIERQSMECDSATAQLKLLAALPQGHVLQTEPLRKVLIDAFVGTDETQSLLAAKVIAKSSLDPTSARKIVDSLPSISVRHLQTALTAVANSGSEATNQELLSSLIELTAARTLPQDFLINLYRKSSPGLREQAARTSRQLEQPTADVQATVAETLARLKPGDSVRGLQVFRSSKAGCSACHRMGYIGNNVGPELTRIGKSRTREALLEAVLFPNSRQEQSYQSTQVLTVDGEVYNGLVKERREDRLTIQIAADRVVEVPLDQIELQKPSDVSIMPSGIGALLNDQELSDLLALLQAAQ